MVSRGDRVGAGLGSLDHHLCLSCLGRLFGKLGHGLTNYERGRSVRILLEAGAVSGDPDMADKGGVNGPSGDVEETEECFICRGLLREVPEFAQLVADTLDEYQYDNFQIGTRIDPEIIRAEELVWNEINANRQEPIKAELNREIGKRIQEITGKNVEMKKPDIVAIVDTAFDHVEVQISPIFFFGRYRKLKRGIPQTKWHCRKCRGRGCESCGYTGKQYRESVEELISAPFLEVLGGSGTKFHGMGREDIDARMLGNGRPFVLEISEPVKRKADLEEMADRIEASAEGKVEVSSLARTERDMVKKVKQTRCPKGYKAELRFTRPVTREELEGAEQVLAGVTVQQRTPNRVSHRRADKIRRRKVHSFEVVEYDEEDGMWAVVSVKGESGLYVKELFHADRGRTEPSLRGCLEEGGPVEVEVGSLDVTEVCYEGTGGG